MSITLLSAVARLSASTLLLQAIMPAALPLKEFLEASKPVVNHQSVPMKGVPLMKVGKAVSGTHQSGVRRSLFVQGSTLLDQEANLVSDIPNQSAIAWRSEALKTKSRLRKGRLLVQLGEVALGHHEPVQAKGLFDRAIAILRTNDADLGLAKFDAALAMFFHGQFAKANAAFRSAAAAPISGVRRKLATLYARHAAACEGYHAQRAESGIPEPSSLDPLCGVSSVAVCLRAFGLHYIKADVESKVRHDGEGSSFSDLINGLHRFGLIAREVKTSQQGLVALPKPIIAHVEHDHFIIVVSADTKGIEYICSDCGPWPGGPNRLTWDQWQMLDADRYLAVARPRTAQALALENLPTVAGEQGHIALASLSLKNSDLLAAAERVLAKIGTSAIGQTSGTPPSPTFCGMRGTSPQCTGVEDMPDDSGGDGSPNGTDDPVSLATGEEEYRAPEGLQVYNPTGPSIDWRPSYFSLANTTPNGFGSGWTHPYNWRIQGLYTGIAHATTSGSCTLILPNSGQIQFTVDATHPPTVSSPTQQAIVQPGYPYQIVWCYGGSPYMGYYVVTTKNRTKITFRFLTDLGAGVQYPTQITDRMGNSIYLNWSVHNFETVDLITGSNQAMGLDSIADSSGNALITFGYDSNGRATSASDRYGRSIYYTVSGFPNTGVPSDFPQSSDGLTAVSQIVSTGAGTVPVRFQYGYQNYGNSQPGESIPYLHTIAVPSPTGSGMSTATINYDSIGEVTDTIDANGNHRIYSAAINDGATQVNSGRVTVTDPLNNLVYQVDEYFDSHMSETKRVNGAGQTVVSKSYADPNDPYRPSSVTNGNNLTWNYTWDTYGNLLTSTTPKSTTTTNTVSYTNFGLGELTSSHQGTKTTTRYSYNEPSGLLQEIDAPVPGESGTGNTQATTYTYDTVGNLTSVTSPGNNAATTRTFTLGYTVDGSYSQSEGLLHPITVTDALGKVWHIRYDSRGNLSSKVDPLGNETDFARNIADQLISANVPATGNTGTGQSEELMSYLYPGGPLSEEDSLNESGTTVRTVHYAYGKEGEILSRTGSAEVATVTYNAAYDTKSVSDGNASKTSYAYDTSGRTTSISYPGATSGSFDTVQFTSYDAVNNLLSRTDGNGQVSNYAYADGDGLLSGVSYPGASSNDLTFAYDSFDRNTSQGDSQGTSENAYDDLGLLVSSTRAYSGLASQTATYEYWPDGSRQSMANAAGTWTYSYDLDGRYTAMSSPAGMSYASWLDNGWQASRTLPNGIVTHYTRNAVGAPSAQLSQTSGGTTLSQYGGFGYDGVFNLVNLTSSIPPATVQGGNTTYSYDSMDRLTGETSSRLSGYSQTYAYDAAGNPTTFRSASAAFNSDNQQVAAGRFAYDGNGNPTTYQGMLTTFDAANHVTSLGSTLSAGYRADGMRASKTTSTGSTYYYYDGGQPVMEMDGSGNVTATNIYAPDGLVAKEQTFTATALPNGSHTNSSPIGGGIGNPVRSGETQYVFDPDGNVAQRTDSAGNVLSSSAYDAYGSESNALGTPADSFGYHARDGYYLDRETGMYLCGHRYYDPQAGRWLNRDPIGVSGGINIYAYCGSRPIGWVDPSGLEIDKAIDAAELAALNGDAAADAAVDRALEGAGAAAEGTGEAQATAVATAAAAAAAAGAAAQEEGAAAPTTCSIEDPAYEDGLPGAQEDYPNKAGNIEKHHITPKYMGGANNGPTVPIDAAYHQKVTNAFQGAYNYNQGPVDDQGELWKIMKGVYKDWPMPVGTPMPWDPPMGE